MCYLIIDEIMNTIEVLYKNRICILSDIINVLDEHETIHGKFNSELCSYIIDVIKKLKKIDIPPIKAVGVLCHLSSLGNTIHPFLCANLITKGVKIKLIIKLNSP